MVRLAEPRLELLSVELPLALRELPLAASHECEELLFEAVADSSASCGQNMKPLQAQKPSAVLFQVTARCCSKRRRQPS